MESMTKDDLDEMVILSLIPILDGEEWSLSEAIDGGASVLDLHNDKQDTKDHGIS